ncbi:MAG: hypothetical protein RLZZ292_2404 [Bacteroidota bacterium]
MKSGISKKVETSFLFFIYLTFSSCSPLKVTIPKQDYSHFPEDFQAIINNTQYYFVQNRKTKHFICSELPFRFLNAPKYPGVKPYIQFLSPSQIKDIFGKPTKEDTYGLYYLAREQKNEYLNKYEFIQFKIGANTKIESMGFRYYSDTKK